MGTSSNHSTILYNTPSLARALLVWRESHLKSCCTISFIELWSSPRYGLLSTNRAAFLYHFYLVDVFPLVWVPDRSAEFHFGIVLASCKSVPLAFEALVTLLMCSLCWSHYRVEVMFTPRYVLHTPHVISVDCLLVVAEGDDITLNSISQVLLHS